MQLLGLARYVLTLSLVFSALPVAAVDAQTTVRVNPCDVLAAYQSKATSEPTALNLRFAAEMYSACTFTTPYDNFKRQCALHLAAGQAFHRAAQLEGEKDKPDRIFEMLYWARADDEYGSARNDCKRADNPLALQASAVGLVEADNFLYAHIK